MNAEEVDEILTEYGVLAGHRAQRMALAVKLAREGLDRSGAERIWQHAKTHSRTPGVLVTKLLDGDWPVLLEDLRRADKREAEDQAKARESERATKGGSYPSHYGKGMEQTFVDRARANGQSLDEFHAERDEQHAAMRVLAERRTVAETAAEMQWLPERVHAAIDRWAPYFGVDPEIVLAICETGTAKARKLFKMT